MKKHKKFSKILWSVALNFIIFSSFSACAKPAQKFGNDSDYFVALQKLKEGKEQEAIAKLNSCIKKGSYYCAKESAKLLTTLGNLQDKNKASINLVKNFPDSDAKLIAVKLLLSTNEINQLINITEGLNFETENNQLIKLRLEALNIRKDSRFDKEVFNWFICKPISQEHYQFYRDTYNPFIIERTENKAVTPQDTAINYRILLYKRNYLEAYDKSQELFDLFDNHSLDFSAYLASDIGKAYLYGNDKFLQNAVDFRKKAALYAQSPAEFYLWFYAGRLYDSGNLYYTQSITCFEKAVAATNDKNQKDNALWYLLKEKSKLSIDDTLKSLETYAKQWSDPEYFDDFFDTLIPTLIVSGKWNAFGPLLNSIDGYASNEVCARIAYIYGRLLEEGYIETESAGDARAKAFERALNCGTAVYYKLLAANKLKLNKQQLESVICSQPKIESSSVNASLIDGKKAEKIAAAEKLLRGYAYFGFPEKIYSEWQNFNKEGIIISTETAMYLSDFLQKCGEQNHKYYTQSLRIAARALNTSERKLTKEEMQLVFPKNYSKYIDYYSQHYELEPSVMYALIRSESFFEADVTSTAGAIGLTQLMEMTGGDIARKLKIKEYSLTDPETNINFGTFYLAELYRRCEYSMLNAFFSYNAGITRVRNWLNSSMIEFGKRNNMSGDLFLETIPYAETREYGRKLVSAALMYDYLYNETTESGFYDNVKNFVK